MKKIKILLFTVFSLLLSTSLIAQEKSISGTVTSKSDGGALPGVSVVVKNTTRGTETDFDGKYTIKASLSRRHFGVFFCWDANLLSHYHT